MVRYRIITKYGADMLKYCLQRTIFELFWITIDYSYNKERAKEMWRDAIAHRDRPKNFKSEVIESE